MGKKHLIVEVGEILKQRGLKLVTAESCTGGGLGYWFTTIPGSSAWFDRGFITYSNAAKKEMLQVKNKTLEKHGAVSEAVVCEMAQGALQNSAAQISIAITGMADPPVGTVWIAWGTQAGTFAKQYLFSGSRQRIRSLAILTALEELMLLLKKL